MDMCDVSNRILLPRLCARAGGKLIVLVVLSLASIDASGFSPTRSAWQSVTSQDDKQETQIDFTARTWTDNRGRTIEGRFGGLVDQTNVRIITAKKTLEVARSNLCPEDQAYVDEILFRFDPRVHGRLWTPLNSVSFRGSFLQTKNKQVWILTSFDDERISPEAVELSPRDLQYVCETLDHRVKRAPLISNQKFRVWTAIDGSWKVIGRLKDVSTTQVLLEQEDEEIEIDLKSLSEADRIVAMEYNQTKQVRGDRTREPITANREDRKPAPDDDQSQIRWSDVSSVHPIFYVFVGVSIFALIVVIAFKYISESFQDDSDSL